MEMSCNLKLSERKQCCKNVFAFVQLSFVFAFFVTLEYLRASNMHNYQKQNLSKYEKDTKHQIIPNSRTKERRGENLA